MSMKLEMDAPDVPKIKELVLALHAMAKVI